MIKVAKLSPLMYRRARSFSFPLAGVGMAAALLISAGCGKGHFSQSAPAADKGILRVLVQVNPSTLDPAKLQDVQGTNMLEQVFCGLTKFDPSLNIVPDLAESWKVSDGGITYTFKLRKGLAFSNGDPLTSADVKYSFDRACDPELKSPVAEEYLNDIQGVEDVVHGKSTSISGITTPDDTTVVFRLVRPIAYFLGRLTYNTGWVVDKKVLTPHHQINSVQEMIGAGPFTATKYIDDQVFEMAPNDHYYGQKTTLKGIRFIIDKEPQSRLNLFSQDQADIYGNVDVPQMATVQTTPQLNSALKVNTRLATNYLGLNLKNYPPFADIRVRTAFAMAFDRSQYIKDVGEGVSLPATGILPPPMPGFRPKTAEPAYNLDEARKLLAAAGYPGGKGLPPITLIYTEGSTEYTRDCEAAQNLLEHSLGVTINVTPLDFTTLLDKENKAQFQMLYLSWFADYPDPQDFISLIFSTKGGENHWGYSNNYVDDLCAKADVTPSGAERWALYAKAEDQILSDAVWIPLTFGRDLELISHRVTGVTQSIYGDAPYVGVSVQD